MRFVNALILLLSTFTISSYATTTDTDSSPAALDRTTTVYYWPLASPSPLALAQVKYNAETLETGIAAYPSLPYVKSPPPNDLVRIGLYDSSTKVWRGSVTAAESFKEGYQGLITLHLDNEGGVRHVGYRASRKPRDGPVEKGKGSGKEQVLKVEVMKPVPGPQPHLNRPVVLSPDGKVPEKEVEKTLFQKYWWVLLGVTVLAMSGGGGDK
ncbi:MAG: hypothetical protein M1827_005951 [Pycnora praestabilis]|nr:MAG: hypothetical protein M1827_005951 [Pycnora praestabilis]